MKNTEPLKIPVITGQEPTAEELRNEYEQGEEDQYEYILSTLKQG
jgi:hypothetical protein